MQMRTKKKKEKSHFFCVALLKNKTRFDNEQSESKRRKREDGQPTAAIGAGLLKEEVVEAVAG
jgi:hypothetical protein